MFACFKEIGGWNATSLWRFYINDCPSSPLSPPFISLSSDILKWNLLGLGTHCLELFQTVLIASGRLMLLRNIFNHSFFFKENVLLTLKTIPTVSIFQLYAKPCSQILSCCCPDMSYEIPYSLLCEIYWPFYDVFCLNYPSPTICDVFFLCQILQIFLCSYFFLHFWITRL